MAAQFGFLIVHGHDRRRGNDVARAVAAQRLNDRREIGTGIFEAADAELNASVEDYDAALVTLFSAPNYCGEFDNAMSVDSSCCARSR